jgi:hypothetical protein
MGILSGFILFVLLVPLVILCRICTTSASNRNLEERLTNLRRDSFARQTDYEVLFTAQNKSYTSTKIGRESIYYAREEVVRRGLDPDKPIDETVKGYPTSSYNYVLVRSHVRKKSLRRR